MFTLINVMLMLGVPAVIGQGELKAASFSNVLIGEHDWGVCVCLCINNWMRMSE